MIFRATCVLLLGVVLLAGAPAGAATPPARHATRAVRHRTTQTLPRVVRSTAPEYPERARRSGISGTVVVRALVGRDGSVRRVEVSRSISWLDSAAVRCVRDWRFRPARSNGVPVSAWVTVPVRFGPDSTSRPIPSSPPPQRAAVETLPPPPSFSGQPGMGEPMMKPLHARLPRDAADPGADALVIVEALIDGQGRVRDARIVSSLPELDQAALDAVRQATFPPPRGATGMRWVGVPVKFHR